MADSHMKNLKEEAIILNAAVQAQAGKPFSRAYKWAFVDGAGCQCPVCYRPRHDKKYADCTTK